MRRRRRLASFLCSPEDLDETPDEASFEAAWNVVLPRLDASSPGTQVLRRPASFASFLLRSDLGPIWEGPTPPWLRVDGPTPPWFAYVQHDNDSAPHENIADVMSSRQWEHFRLGQPSLFGGDSKVPHLHSPEAHHAAASSSDAATAAATVEDGEPFPPFATMFIAFLSALFAVRLLREIIAGQRQAAPQNGDPTTTAPNFVALEVPGQSPFRPYSGLGHRLTGEPEPSRDSPGAPTPETHPEN